MCLEILAKVGIQSSRVSFEAYKAVIFQVEVFWVVTPCSVVIGYQRFRGPCILHLRSHTQNSVIINLIILCGCGTWSHSDEETQIDARCRLLGYDVSQ